MLKGYRTIVFNVIMLALMVASQLGYLKPEESPNADQVNVWLDSLDVVLTGAWALGNIGLRAITNTPLGKKE